MGLRPPGSAGSSVQHNGAAVTNPNFVDATSADLVALGLAYGLLPTAIKTANYTAGLHELVRCDATGGSFTITLPSGTAVDRAMFGASLVAVSGTNTVTLRTGGTDVFDQTGGPTTKTLKVAGQRIVAQYDPASGVWIITTHSVSLDAADARYSPLGATGYTTERKVQSAGTVLETMSRNSAVNSAGSANNQGFRCMLATIPAGKTLTTLKVYSGTTAGVTIANQWLAVFRRNADKTGTFLSATEDRTTEAWAANTRKVFTLATPQPAGASDLDIIIGLMINAATVPTFAGANVPTAVAGDVDVPLAYNSGVGLTTPAAFGSAALATPSGGAIPFYIAGS